MVGLCFVAWSCSLELVAGPVVVVSGGPVLCSLELVAGPVVVVSGGPVSVVSGGPVS